MPPRIIRKIGLALFQEKKVIMLRDNRNDEVFYFAGGTVEEGETDTDCLAREIEEELAVQIDLDSLQFLAEFEAPAHGKENTIVQIRLYTGEIIGTPQPSQEIVEIAYFDSSVDPKHLSALALDAAFPWLKEHEYIS